jgi:hypothetical protein
MKRIIFSLLFATIAIFGLGCDTTDDDANLVRTSHTPLYGGGERLEIVFALASTETRYVSIAIGSTVFINSARFDGGDGQSIVCESYPVYGGDGSIGVARCGVLRYGYVYWGGSATVYSGGELRINVYDAADRIDRNYAIYVESDLSFSDAFAR